MKPDQTNRTCRPARRYFEFRVDLRGREPSPVNHVRCVRDAHRGDFLLTFPPAHAGTSEVVVVIHGEEALEALRRAVARPHGEGDRSLIDPPEGRFRNEAGQPIEDDWVPEEDW